MLKEPLGYFAQQFPITSKKYLQKMTKSRNVKKSIAALFFTVCFLLYISYHAAAQVIDSETTQQQILPNQFDSEDSLNVAETEVQQADSMTAPKISFANVDVPTFEDSIYQARLALISTPITLTYNAEVRRYIDLYVLNRRSQVERMLGLSKFYFPIFDQIFADYGIPPEIKNLAIIESALNPNAISKAGATGMWQFMYGTAKVYKLSVNNYVDERRDIIRSTEGAAQYLKGMYEVYGDWLLAIASYNCGPQNVNRAITRSGGNTFWAIKDYLPKETRAYVPAFIAATYVMNYYEAHDLEPDYPKYCWDSIASVQISDKMSCEHIARFTNMSVDEVRFLNPGLRCSVIPALDEPYYFKMPSDRLELFQAKRDSIVMLSLNSKQQYYYGAAGEGRVYVVRNGDNLGKIAARYHVTVTQIKKWNNLHSTTILAGQRLRLYSSHYEEVAATSNVKKTASSVAKTTANSGSSSQKSSTAGVSLTQVKYVYYKTRYGDTLWDIARKHGTTIESIKSLNGSSKCDNLKAGTVLKINSKS